MYKKDDFWNIILFFFKNNLSIENETCIFQNKVFQINKNRCKVYLTWICNGIFVIKYQSCIFHFLNEIAQFDYYIVPKKKRFSQILSSVYKKSEKSYIFSNMEIVSLYNKI